uniref:Uncharacterized protein n=1 Tax=Candidatus Nitrotoga fabula TaxID=2182327 RepID=A0A2X0SHV5_9PROT|nr:protein of unknown function [Candidatus Nitrotoga fabula]
MAAVSREGVVHPAQENYFLGGQQQVIVEGAELGQFRGNDCLLCVAEVNPRAPLSLLGAGLGFLRRRIK